MDGQDHSCACVQKWTKPGVYTSKEKKEVSGNIKVRLISEKPTLCFNNATFFELHAQTAMNIHNLYNIL